MQQVADTHSARNPRVLCVTTVARAKDLNDIFDRRVSD